MKRNHKLTRKADALLEHKSDLVAAIQRDTGKPEFEAELEVLVVQKQLRQQYIDTDFQVLTKRVAVLRQGGHILAGFGSALIVGHWTGAYLMSDLLLKPFADTGRSAFGFCHLADVGSHSSWQCSL